MTTTPVWLVFKARSTQGSQRRLLLISAVLLLLALVFFHAAFSPKIGQSILHSTVMPWLMAGLAAVSAVMWFIALIIKPYRITVWDTLVVACAAIFMAPAFT